MKRDYATTFLTEVFVIASYLIVFRLVASRLGPVGFGEYALARRTLSVLAPVSALGVDMGVARFIAFTSNARGGRFPEYVLPALLVTTAAAAALSGALLLFQGFFADMFFGWAGYAPLIAPFPLLLFGTGLHGIAYGYLRGRLRIQRANLVMALNHGVVPIVAVTAFGGSVATVLVAIGVGWIVVSTVVLLALSATSTNDLWPQMKELLRFGVPRVPGDVLQLTLFALPGILLAHSTNVETAGVVAFGIAALGMVGSALTPVQFVLLPIAARMLALGSIDTLRKHVWDLVRVTTGALVSGTIALEVMAQPLVAGYLGPGFVGGVPNLRLLMLAALPWGLHVSLRSVIDARHVQAINARNTGIAFLGFVLIEAAFRWLFPGWGYGVVVAFVLSLYLLAGLTLARVFRITADHPAEALAQGPG